MFGFFPLFRQALRNYSENASNTLSVVASLINIVLLFTLSNLAAFGYICVVVFITMISPLIFIYAYQFKNDIQGPWDIPQVMQYTSLE